MGQDGPIFNPKNITYLSPDQAQQAGLTSSPGSDLVGLSAGLAGINLMTSMGTLAFSAAILSEVKKISSRIDELRAFSVQTLDKLEGVSKRLNIIDIKVSENNLRHALNHVATSSVHENCIDLTEVKKLENDLQNFFGSVDRYWYGSDASFSLSTDVRDRLTGLQTFLYKVRQMVARRHNLKTGGDPMRLLTMHPVYDYAIPGSGYKVAPLLMKKLSSEIWAVAYEVGNRVHDQFTWSSEEDIEKYAQMVGVLCDKVIDCYREVDLTGVSVSDCVIDKVDENTDLDAIKKLVEEWEVHWLLRTDMGLVWRTWAELVFLGDYKANVDHWMNVETKPLGSENLLIDCTWKRSA